VFDNNPINNLKYYAFIFESGRCRTIQSKVTEVQSLVLQAKLFHCTLEQLQRGEQELSVEAEICQESSILLGVNTESCLKIFISVCH
jgi:hypothetical protein